MASTSRWVLGTLTTLTFTAGDLNSLASGGYALTTVALANQTNLDQYGLFSFIVTVGGTTLAGQGCSLFVLPLNQDGTTWGDGSASSTSAQPMSYFQGIAIPKVGVTTGNTIVGTFQPVLLPPASLKIGFGNNLGIALSATAALTLKCQGFNENLNA